MRTIFNLRVTLSSIKPRSCLQSESSVKTSVTKLVWYDGKFLHYTVKCFDFISFLHAVNFHGCKTSGFVALIPLSTAQVKTVRSYRMVKALAYSEGSTKI